MTYIRISLGILLVTVAVILAAFLILITAVIITRTVQSEKDRRAKQNLANLRERSRTLANLREELRLELAHDDDLK